MIEDHIDVAPALLRALNDARREADNARAELRADLSDALAGQEAASAIALLHQHIARFEEAAQQGLGDAIAALSSAEPMTHLQRQVLLAALSIAFEAGCTKGLGDGLLMVDPSLAVAKADARRKGPRDRIPEWARLFRPIAEDYCSGRDKVSLGELVRLVRAHKGIPHLPGEDKSIRSILKKMVDLGLLEIPGYVRSEGGA